MAAVVFGYRHGTSFLHGLDARVKLAALALIGLASLRTGPTGLVLVLVLVLLLIVRLRLPIGRWLAGLQWFLLLLPAIVIVRALTAAGDPLIVIAAVPLSKTGVEEGLLLAGRLLLLTLGGLLLAATTRPAQIRAAVAWLLRPVPFVPHQQVATMIGLLVRFIPVILTQATEQGDALRARAIDNRRNPLRRMSYLCLPLVRRTFVTADRLAMAMEARCYGSSECTGPSGRMSRFDGAALGGIIMFCILLVTIF